MAKLTCTPCRIKKIKCDGKSPKCGPCIRGRKKLPVDCTFHDDAFGKLKATPLIKGKACLPCRRKKKKCDGVQPCATCVKAGGAQGCVIEEQPSAPPRKTKTCKTKPPGPVSTAGTDLLPGQVSSSPILLRPVPSTRRSIRPSELHSPTSLCDFPAFFLPAEPSLISNPFVPLHLEDVQDPYSFSLSDVSMDDLEMNFRLTFLSHRLSFGFQLPFAKQQAILMKDTSGTFINPFFVHFSHMFGCHFYQERRAATSLTYLHAMHMQLCWESLLPMREEDDPMGKAQAWLFMTSASCFTHNIVRAKVFIKRCLDTVKRNGIRFLPHSDEISSDTLELTEENHERVVFLGQLLYWLVYLYLVDGHVEDAMHDLERQFRFELPCACPVLFKICPITLRVASMISAKDANDLISQYNEHKTTTSPWLIMCRMFISSQLSLISKLSLALTDFNALGDTESCLTLRCSIIISLTTLAELYHVLARNPMSTDSSAAEFGEKCVDALGDMMSVAEGLGSDDFRFLDPFLGVCWSRAISLFTNTNLPSPLLPFIPPTCTLSSPRPSFNDLQPLPPSSPFSLALAQTVSVLTKSHDQFIRVRFWPALGVRLCKRMGEHDFRRNPNAPNYLNEDVKRFYGL